VSLLVLVRHGKASSFSPDDYDQLSELGIRQSRLLGEYWANEHTHFDRVWVGPRRRQQETYEAVAAAFRVRGTPFPEPTTIEELDEHHGIKLVFALLPEIARDDEVVRKVAEEMARGESPSPHEVLEAFRRITRRWAAGEVGHESVETWQGFRARVARGIDRITNEAGKGQTILAFTSAGAIAAAVGLALGLDDGRVLDLSWMLHNASLTELLFTEGTLGLRTFNTTPHLRERALVTSV
jgi:broad specificity phosphatase PhoE